jgi:multiple antibiotic resistance protein
VPILFQNSLYMLALINPVSKVFILSMLPEERDEAGITCISVRSSLIALIILAALALAGNFILTVVFHVELYSLRLAGGLVLLTVGLHALQRGVFFETSEDQKITDISVVPLAAPLIAGPATITAAISMSAEHGIAHVVSVLIIAVSTNLIIMLGSRRIGGFLSAHQVMGPLIRITGLIVATIAVQMMLSGIAIWWAGAR